MSNAVNRLFSVSGPTADSACHPSSRAGTLFPAFYYAVQFRHIILVQNAETERCVWTKRIFDGITMSPRPHNADVSGRKPATDAQRAPVGDAVATVSPKNTDYSVFFMRNSVSHARISCARGFSYIFVSNR